jgi:hypothetical protein
VAWISNSRDSVYVAVAAGGGGLQIARVPATGAPVLVLAQQTSGTPCAVATAMTGIVATAHASGGVALFQSPGRAALDLVTPGAGAPYTAPVVLGSGTSFPGGVPLERAHFQNPAGGATSLAFEPTAGPLPDLFVSDSSRLLVLRPGAMTVTAVEREPRLVPSVKGSIRLDVFPNPVGAEAIVRARVAAVADITGGPALLRATARIDILDVQGRMVRTLRGSLPPSGSSPTSGTGSDVAEIRLAWDGRDRAGRRVPSGRYWARLRSDGRTVGGATPFLVLK